MPKFKRIDVAGLLGFTPIARVPDSEIWAMLLTPQVRALLGDVVSIEGPMLTEDTKGFFPGDEASNLNDHRLYGGQSNDKVRIPYLNTLYRTKYGALVIKRDGMKIKALGWHGDVDKGTAKLIYKAALRDRRFDGTKRGNDTALLDFPFDDPTLNAPLPKGTGCELSIYGFQPRSRITEFFGKDEAEYEKFVGSPFEFLDRPELFLQYFQRAWRGELAPGQVAAPIPDVSRLIVPQFEQIARKRGYDFMENASSHYHVAMWARAMGYAYTYEHDARVMAVLAAGIKKVKSTNPSLTRQQESWLCVVQSLRPIELIPEGLYFGGPEWPQNNIDQKNLWMVKPLRDSARDLLTFPLAK